TASNYRLGRLVLYKPLSTVVSITALIPSFELQSKVPICNKTLQTMQFQWAIVAAVLFEAAVVAIPCSEIGWSTGNKGEGQAGLDPFDPQGRWEVVKANECWVRFQSYNAGQNPDEVRVTKTEFKATPEQVRGTINNYNNEGGTNIQLWLPLTSRSFQYAKVVPGNLGPDFEVIAPQGSIDEYHTILSIILPSGVKKLKLVRPASADAKAARTSREPRTSEFPGSTAQYPQRTGPIPQSLKLD
ncbi:hypothetical protein LB504_010381, partial [Fusarium proliferatum]